MLISTSDMNNILQMIHNPSGRWYLNKEKRTICTSSERLRCRKLYVRARDWDAEGTKFERTTQITNVACSSARLRCRKFHIRARDWDAEAYMFERAIEMSEVTCSSGRLRCRKFHNWAHDWDAEGYMFKWTTEMSKIICSSSRLRCRRICIRVFYIKTIHFPTSCCISAFLAMFTRLLTSYFLR